MTDILVCPVCVERSVLRPLDLQGSLRVPLHRCDTCHGVWTDAETAAIAADHYHESHYATRPGHGRQGCRGCGRHFTKLEHECPTCRANQQLRCLSCGKGMRLIEIASVTLDVCVPCRGVWFDRGELGLIIYDYGRKLQRRVDAEGGEVTLRERAGLGPLDFVPDVTGVGDLAAGAGNAVVEVTSSIVDGGGVEVIEAAGEIAVSAGDAVADGASVAVEAVVEVVAGIFSGL
jgi:Zn-finger nucleic acid-binding protein